MFSVSGLPSKERWNKRTVLQQHQFDYHSISISPRSSLNAFSISFECQITVPPTEKHERQTLTTRGQQTPLTHKTTSCHVSRWINDVKSRHYATSALLFPGLLGGHGRRTARSRRGRDGRQRLQPRRRHSRRRRPGRRRHGRHRRR